MEAYRAVEWLGHDESRARRCSGDDAVVAKQNVPLPWLGKRGKRVGVEEVMMVELQASRIG